MWLHHFFSKQGIVFLFAVALSTPLNAGFFLPDSIQEMTIRYKSIGGLIVLPVTLNNTVKANLILDTGCRNLVLFGKRFMSQLKCDTHRKVQFSGLGSGAPVQGSLSLNNEVSIYDIMGKEIPIVVVPERNIFQKKYPSVDGVIGYEIFLMFEIELNAGEQMITFRPALSASLRDGYYPLPLRVVDSRPHIPSCVMLRSGKTLPCDVMVDTGSELGLLLKMNNAGWYEHQSKGTESVIGFGLNGAIKGFTTQARKLILYDFVISSIPAGITFSPWHSYASIGMKVLRDYILVLNYCKAYAGLKKLS